MAIVKNRSARSYAKTPNVTTNYNAVEIEVANEMVRVVSLAENLDTFRKYYHYWKFQHDLRIEYSMTEQESSFREGLARFLLFKTPKFHRRFFNKTTNALSTVKRWNRVYHRYMEELATRVIAEKKGYFSGQTDLQQVDVWVALSNVALAHWVGGSQWANDEEKHAYQTAISGDLPAETEINLDGDDPLNKAIYIFLIPYEGPSNPKKRNIQGKPVSNITVAVCPIVPVVPGDFLGVLSGKVRYATEVGNITKYVQGPSPNLWLDFSKFTGRLSCMKIAEKDDEINVKLSWKRIDCENGPDWRIEVTATKPIGPFEQLLRPAPPSRAQVDL